MGTGREYTWYTHKQGQPHYQQGLQQAVLNTFATTTSAMASAQQSSHAQQPCTTICTASTSAMVIAVQCLSSAYLLQRSKQCSNTTSAKVQRWQSETVDQDQHNVLPAKGGSVLPDGLHLRQWDGMNSVQCPVCKAKQAVSLSLSYQS